MFNVVDNEAQLAAVIGHEIAHATQEHTWRQMNYHKNALTALAVASAFAGAFSKTAALGDIGKLVEGAVRNGYSGHLRIRQIELALSTWCRLVMTPERHHNCGSR